MFLAVMLISMTLVLQKLVSSLDADEECAEILLQAWYLGNGALAGTRSVVLRALHFALEIDPDSVKVAVGKGQRVGYLIPPSDTFPLPSDTFSPPL